MEVLNLKLCEFCNESPGIYLCPKCDCRYCSLSCYRCTAHEFCSESFYKHEVLKEMELRDVDSKTKANVMEMMDKYNDHESDSFDSDDDEPIETLEERIKGISLDDSDAVWEKLTEAERLEYNQLLANGDIYKCLPDYVPWWNKRKVTSIDPLEECTDQGKLPIIVEAPKFNILMKGSPSPLLKHNLRNILFCYCFVHRVYHGCFHDILPESCELFFHICEVLGKNYNFTNPVEAHERASALGLQCPLMQVNKLFIAEVADDVSSFLDRPMGENNKGMVLHALSDLHLLIHKTLEVTANQGSSNVASSNTQKNYCQLSGILHTRKSQLKLGIKKLEFYISWVMEFFDSLYLQNH